MLISRLRFLPKKKKKEIRSRRKIGKNYDDDNYFKKRCRFCSLTRHPETFGRDIFKWTERFCFQPDVTQMSVGKKLLGNMNDYNSNINPFRIVVNSVVNVRLIVLYFYFCMHIPFVLSKFPSTNLLYDTIKYNIMSVKNRV